MKYISCHVYNKNGATNEVCRCDEVSSLNEKKRLRGAISWASGKLVDAGDDKSADHLLDLLADAPETKRIKAIKEDEMSCEEFQEAIMAMGIELDRAMVTLGDQDAEILELKALLVEGVRGFSGVLIQTSDMAGVKRWTEKVRKAIGEQEDETKKAQDNKGE